MPKSKKKPKKQVEVGPHLTIIVRFGSNTERDRFAQIKKKLTKKGERESWSRVVKAVLLKAGGSKPTKKSNPKPKRQVPHVEDPVALQ
jgi:hypothetical protein